MDATINKFILGTIGLDLFIPNAQARRKRQKGAQAWRKVFHAGILIEPHIPELDEFKKYFNNAIQVLLL